MDPQLFAFVVRTFLPLRARCCGAGPDEKSKIAISGGWYSPTSDAATRLFVSPLVRAASRDAPLCTEDITTASVWWWIKYMYLVQKMPLNVRVGDVRCVDDGTITSLAITELKIQPKRAAHPQGGCGGVPPLGTVDWEAVVAWIVGMPSVTRLTWSVTDFDPLKTALELRCQSSPQALTHLDVSFCSLGDASVAHALLIGTDGGAATPLLPHLRLLNIQSNRVGPQTVAALASPWWTAWADSRRAASTGPVSGSASSFAIETLDVSNNRLNGAMCDSLGQTMFARISNTLRHLAVRRNDLSDTPLANFSAALSNAFFLEDLDMQYCKLKCPQVSSLCSHLATTMGGGLREHRFLKILLLRSNAIGSVGGLALAAALPSMTALTQLDVGCNPNIGDAAVASIVRSLNTLQSLNAIKLGKTGAGRRTAEALCEYITTPFAHPPASGGGVGSIARRHEDGDGGGIEAVPPCSVSYYHCLDVLELESNQIDHVGAIALVAALKLRRGSIIGCLDLSHNDQSLDFGEANDALYNLRALRADPSPRCVLW